MIPHNPDAYTTAINEGLLEKSDHPIHEMHSTINKNFDILGYGVDLNVKKGLAKLWTLIVPISIDKAYSILNIPRSVKKHADFFTKHGLNTFSLFALDFLSNTLNIYFMIKDPTTSNPELYKSMLDDLNFDIDSSEVLEKCCEARTIYFTFNWESELIERVCFGMVCPSKDDVPVNFHPLMKQFVEEAPFADDIRRFIYSIAFSRKGNYFKVENDYNGTMIELLMMSTQAGITFNKFN